MIAFGRTFRRCSAGLAWFIMIAAAAVTSSGQNQASPEASTPSVDEIVRNLAIHNAARESLLTHYVSQRRYHVEYHGFPSSSRAEMEVQLTYDAPSSKTFRVLSESGSAALIKHVLHRLMDEEKRAAADHSSTDLSPANYTFRLLESTSERGRPAYVLHVDPRTHSKFLIRGKVWIDAQDFAVVKVEAEPAQTPSFWIRDIQISRSYSKCGEVWVPQQNLSDTKVRFGGTAHLNIEYVSYDLRKPDNQAASGKASADLAQANSGLAPTSAACTLNSAASPPAASPTLAASH